jgi:hypothetical protein
MQDPARVGISIGIFKDGKSYFYNYGTTKLESHNFRLPKVFMVPPSPKLLQEHF